jgi:hypothetical protein
VYDWMKGRVLWIGLLDFSDRQCLSDPGGVR